MPVSMGGAGALDGGRGRTEGQLHVLGLERLATPVFDQLTRECSYVFNKVVCHILQDLSEVPRA